MNGSIISMATSMVPGEVIELKLDVVSKSKLVTAVQRHITISIFFNMELLSETRVGATEDVICKT